MSSLSEDLNAPPEKSVVLGDMEDRVLVEELQARGWILHLNDPEIERHVELDAPQRGKVRIAISSDTHLASKYQQITHWKNFCKIAGEWKADFALHAGDVFDGIHKMHRGMEYEQFLHGGEAHRKYGTEHWPEIKVGKRTIPWKVIGGNHDGSYWNESGMDILTGVASARDDIEFIGAPAATFHVSGLNLYLVHPDGGVPYARSYKPQKAVEQMPPDDKPHLWIAGHWHVPNHTPGYRNVEAITLPCFQAQTPYLRRKTLSPVIGGLLLECEFSERGLEDMTTKWVLYRTPIEKDWP